MQQGVENTNKHTNETGFANSNYASLHVYEADKQKDPREEKQSK